MFIALKMPAVLRKNTFWVPRNINANVRTTCPLPCSTTLSGHCDAVDA